MMKKLLLLLLVLAMLIQPVYAENADVAEYGDVSFAIALGIMDYDAEGVIDPEEEVTREYFAKVLVEIMYRGGEVVFATPKQSFSDVTSENPNYGYITTAVELGLIKADGDSFNPAELVTYEDLCYGLISAVNQGAVGEAMGGYPEGYTRLATSMNILSGVSLTKSLTKNSLAKIIRNLLDADYYDVENGANQTKYEKTNKTVLEGHFDIKEIEGKLITGRALGDDNSYAVIDGETYETTLMLEQLLGQSVKAYYNEKTDELIYVERLNNENLLIFYNEVVDYSNGTLTYEISGKKYTAEIDPKATSFKNGLKVDFSEKLFWPNEGFINIIKNQKSNIYDTVISTESETVVVGGINPDKRVIYDKYDSGKKIDLDEYNSDVVIIKDDKEIELSDLKQYDCLMVIFPEGGNFVTIYVTDMGISGKITEVGDDYIVVNNADKYYCSQYFVDFKDPISLGGDYNIYVDILGRVVAVQATNNTNQQYAYFMDMLEVIDDDCLLVKYMDANGEIHRAGFADRVRINGINVKPEIGNETITTTFKTNFVYDAVAGYKTEVKDFYVRQPIKIKLSEDGLITEIDTAIKEEKENEDSLILDNIVPASTTLRYRNSPRQFGSKFGLSSNCIIFGVPNTENNSLDARKTLIDDHYAVLSAGSAFRNDGYYGDLYVFDVTDGGACNMIVKRAPASISAVDPDSSTSIFVVEKVTKGVNENDEVSYIVKGYMEGKQVEYALASDDLVTPYLKGDALGITEEQRNQKIAPGDVLQISLNNQGEIEGIYYRFDYANKKILVPSDINQSGAGSEDAYKAYYGKVYKNDINGLRMSDGATGNIDDFSIANLNTFMSKSISLIYVYDSEEKVVRQGTWDELISSEFNYSDASTVYVRTRWNDPMQMVIYK